MSINDYIDGLDYDQLQFARDYAARRMEALDAEDRVPLWIVSEGMINHAAFREDGYQDAIEYIAKRLKDRFSVTGHVRDEELDIRLEKRRFRESEVKEVLELTPA